MALLRDSLKLNVFIEGPGTLLEMTIAETLLQHLLGRYGQGMSTMYYTVVATDAHSKISGHH